MMLLAPADDDAAQTAGLSLVVPGLTVLPFVIMLQQACRVLGRWTSHGSLGRFALSIFFTICCPRRWTQVSDIATLLYSVNVIET